MAKRVLSSPTEAWRGRGFEEPNGHLSVIAPGKRLLNTKNLTAAGVVGGLLAEEQPSLASDLSA